MSAKTYYDDCVERLYKAYCAYHRAAAKNDSDQHEYATACTQSYLDYLKNMTSPDEEGRIFFDWGDFTVSLENQIRIVVGYIGCYDKPIIRDKKTLKTRWSL